MRAGVLTEGRRFPVHLHAGHDHLPDVPLAVEEGTEVSIILYDVIYY